MEEALGIYLHAENVCARGQDFLVDHIFSLVRF